MAVRVRQISQGVYLRTLSQTHFRCHEYTNCLDLIYSFDYDRSCSLFEKIFKKNLFHFERDVLMITIKFVQMGAFSWSKSNPCIVSWNHMLSCSNVLIFKAINFYIFRIKAHSFLRKGNEENYLQIGKVIEYKDDYVVMYWLNILRLFIIFIKFYNKNDKTSVVL